MTERMARPSTTAAARLNFATGVEDARVGLPPRILDRCPAGRIYAAGYEHGRPEHLACIEREDWPGLVPLVYEEYFAEYLRDLERFEAHLERDDDHLVEMCAGVEGLIERVGAETGDVELEIRRRDEPSEDDLDPFLAKIYRLER